MQQDHLTKSFGLIIAFIVPGMIGLYAASFPVPALRDWFGVASSQPPTVSGFLFVNVAAAGAGVFLSGIRWLVLEYWFWEEKDPGGRISIAERQRSEPVYQNLVAQFYDFYLFYGNTLVALILLYFAWVFTEGFHWWLAGTNVALVVVIPVLARSACSSLDHFRRARGATLFALIGVLVVSYAAWAFTDGLYGLVWAWVALAAASPVLERSARNSFDRFHDRREKLLLKEVA